MKRISLGQMNIGHLDANNDENAYYFDGLKYFDLLQNDEKRFVILGEKGMGKTSLAKEFSNKQNINNTASKKISISSLNNEILRWIIDDSALKNKILLFYRYYLLIEIAKILIEKRITFQIVKNILTKNPIKYIVAKKELKRLINENNSEYDLKSFDTDNILKAKFSRKNVDTVLSSGSKKHYEKKFDSFPLYKLEKQIKSILCYIKVVLIFDDIEDCIIFKDKHGQIADFINIIKDINDNVIMNNGRLIIVLRSSVFDEAVKNSNNFNKIREDCSIEINWNKNYDEGKIPPLLELIMMKLIKNNEFYNNKTPEQLFDLLFPRLIKEIPIKNYIMNATFGRPRDIVAMLLKIKETYPNNTSFDEHSFLNTRLEYSKYFYQELNDDLSFDLDESDKEYLFNVFKDIGKTDFEISDIKQVLENYKFTKCFTAESFVGFCFEKNILGYISIDKNGKKHYNWKYKNPGLKCDYAKRLTLHQGLIKFLLNK